MFHVLNPYLLAITIFLVSLSSLCIELKASLLLLKYSFLGFCLLAIEIGLTGNAFIARAENRTNNAHFNIEHLVKISLILDIKIEDFFKR